MKFLVYHIRKKKNIKKTFKIFGGMDLRSVLLQSFSWKTEERSLTRRETIIGNNKKWWRKEKISFWVLGLKRSRNTIIIILRYYYGEFDPGSGWTLAGGLIHASRTAALLNLFNRWRVAHGWVTRTQSTLKWGIALGNWE